MKTLILKEIRLLLPAWIAAMVLAVVPGMLNIAGILWAPYNPNGFGHSVSFFFVQLMFAVGVLLLGIDSFGQELSCNTFSALISQPMKRPRVWHIKVATLAAAFLSVWLTAILFASLQIGVSDQLPEFYLHPKFSDTFEFLTLSALVAFSGGLWTTLLLRQLTGAIWFSLLTPLAIVFGITTFYHDWIVSEKGIDVVVASALVLYSIAGYFLARRLFIRAQDVQWTGGEISSRFGEGGSKIKAGSLSIRTRHWFSALAWKELQLHQATFLIAAIVLVFHVTACLIRRFHPLIQNSTLDFVLGNFWILWLLMPLLIGAAAIAEERRMGTLEPQLSLPVSRSGQLSFKFSIALLLSLFFGAVIPALIELSICGTNVGTSGVWVIARNDVAPNQWYWVVVVAAAIFFVSFYASSLRRTALQAIGFAILVAVIISLYEAVTAFAITSRPMSGFNFNPRFGIELLSRDLGPPMITLVLGWLTFSNFKRTQQNKRLWLRNIAAILAAFICIPLIAQTIYFRPWERFLPLEPRGLVRITDPTRVKFVANRGGFNQSAMYAIAPNGRLWFQPFTYGIPEINFGRGQFVGGSNWVDVAVNGYEVLAIQSNGTLWNLGGKTGPAAKTQIGTDNDWSQVAGGLEGFLILKNNGSLWSWGTHRNNWNGKGNPNPPLNQKLQRDFASQPAQMGDDTNWTSLYSTGLFSPYARDKNGNLWVLAGKHMLQETNVDKQWLSLHFGDTLSHVEVQTNGGLLYFDQNRMFMRQPGGVMGFRPRQASQEQLGEPWKWKTAAFGPINGGQTVMAIRSDGTLWKFPLRQPPGFTMGTPVQLGTRSDWVAVSQGFSLASDGSIWTWNEHSKYDWLAPSRRPVCVGNIFEEPAN